MFGVPMVVVVIGFLFWLPAVVVWLIFIGEWRLVISGTIVAIVFPWAHIIVCGLPAYGLMVAGMALRKYIFILSFLILLLVVIYQQIIMFAYSFLVIYAVWTRVAFSSHYILLSLFGLGVVICPLAYMTKKDDSPGSTFGFFVAWVSYIMLAIFYLTDMPIFLIFLGILIIITVSIQGVMAYEFLDGDRPHIFFPFTHKDYKGCFSKNSPL